MARTASGSCRCAVRGRGRAHPPEAMAAGSSGEAEAQALRQPPVHPCAALQPQSGCHLAAPAQQAPRPGRPGPWSPAQGPVASPARFSPARPGPVRMGQPGPRSRPARRQSAGQGLRCSEARARLRRFGRGCAAWSCHGEGRHSVGAHGRHGSRQARGPWQARAACAFRRAPAVAIPAPCVARGGGVLRVSAGARGAGALDARRQGCRGQGAGLDTAREGHETAGTGRGRRVGGRETRARREAAGARDARP